MVKAIHVAIIVVVSAWYFTEPCAGALSDENSYANEENFGLGPFSVRTHSLQYMLRPGQIPNSSYLITAGDLNATFGVGYANVWNYSTNKFKVDGEWGNVDIRLAYALTDRLEFGVLLPFSMRQGGFLDGFIEGFHDTFGFENVGRDDTPRDEARVAFYDEQGKVRFVTEGSSYGINDIPVFFVWQFTRGDKSKPAIMIKPYVTIPTGNESELEGTGKPVYGISVMAAKKLGRSLHYVYAEAEYSYSDNDSWAGFMMNKSIIGGSLAWEYRWSPQTSIIAQYMVRSGIAEEYDEWTQETHHLNLGVKKHLAKDVLVEISLQENLFHYNTSSDLGLNAAVSTTF